MERSSLALQIEDSRGIRHVPLLQPVSRVGAAADSEIRLDGIAPVALVLFQQEQRLFVQNRSEKHLVCGRQQLPVGQRIPWPVLHQLQLDGAVLTPVRATDLRESRESEPVTAVSAASKSSATGSQRPQLLLIIACMILAVPMTASLLHSDHPHSGSLQMQSCLQELGVALDQPQLQPSVRQRLQTLARLLQRCRMSEGDNWTAENPDRRDAIAYCQSLAATELDSVTDFERQLARQLAFLLANGK